MEWWKTIWWLVATLGVAGTIALFVLAPTVFAKTFEVVVRLFTLLVSYRAGCALLAAIAAALVTDYWRHSRDDAEFAARVAAFEQAQKDRDTRIAKETREDVWKEIANATAANDATDKQVKDFHDALPPVPSTGNAFIVGAASCRLRQIAGFAGCGPDRTQGVPQAGSEGPGTGRPDWAKYRLPGLITRGFGRVE